MSRALSVAGALTAAATLTGCAHQFGPYSERESLLLLVHGEPDEIMTRRDRGWFEFDLFGTSATYYPSWDDYIEAWSRYDDPRDADRAMNLESSKWLYDDGRMLELRTQGSTNLTQLGDDERDEILAIRLGTVWAYSVFAALIGPSIAAGHVIDRTEPLATRLITDPVELLYTPEPMRWAVWP